LGGGRCERWDSLTMEPGLLASTAYILIKPKTKAGFTQTQVRYPPYLENLGSQQLLNITF